jgi:hypothetical protein
MIWLKTLYIVVHVLCIVGSCHDIFYAEKTMNKTSWIIANVYIAVTALYFLLDNSIKLIKP